MSTLTGPLKVDDFLLSGTMSDCARHPHKTVACIGSPTPCEVSEIDIGTPLFVSCPAGDLDVEDTVTVILRDSDSSPVSGIPARVANCELTASKHVRSVNVVRWEDDPLMPPDDEVNDSDMQVVSDAMFTAEPCFDFFETYRCPVVTQASLDMVNTHYGHSCSVTASTGGASAPCGAVRSTRGKPNSPGTGRTPRPNRSRAASTWRASAREPAIPQ